MNLYAFVGNDGVNWIDFLGLADIEITITRQYLKDETLGTFIAIATDEKATECCGSVSGQTLEQPKGEFELEEYKTYFHGIKNYPIPEGNHTGKFTHSTATSPQVMDPYKGSDNRATIVDGNKNIDIINSKFQATRMHAGTSCMSSRGCPIVGEDAEVSDITVTENDVGAREGQIGKTIRVHRYDYKKSWQKAIEINQFINCVAREIGKPTPSISVSIGSKK